MTAPKLDKERKALATLEERLVKKLNAYDFATEHGLKEALRTSRALGLVRATGKALVRMEDGR